MGLFDLFIAKAELEDEINEYWTCPRCQSYVKTSISECDRCNDLDEAKLLQLIEAREEEVKKPTNLSLVFFAFAVFTATTMIASWLI